MALPLAAVGDGVHYVDCAFNFNNGSDVAILFTGRKCLQFNYVEDSLIKNLLSIGDFFPCLQNQEFSGGLDAAFISSEKNQVYMFKNDKFLVLNFSIENDNITSSNIFRGPMKIVEAFKCLKGTPFEHRIDAAFASDQSTKAYIFNKKQYALLNFNDDTLSIAPQDFTNDFPSLSSTVFKNGLDAAFNSSTKNEAYIFRGNTYAKINYEGIISTSHGFQSSDCVKETVTPITKGFTSLADSIPSSA